MNALVHARNYGFAHGIGRSGNLLDDQPKAPGSSALHQITLGFAKSALKLAGFTGVQKCLILPLATGMSIGYCVQALRLSKKRVLWIRCDQKSVPKALELVAPGRWDALDCEQVERDLFEVLSRAKISTEGRENRPVAAMRADTAQIEALLKTGAYSAVVSTVSCFAPREPDLVVQIQAICDRYGCVQVVNNAYGTQSRYVMSSLNQLKKSSRFVVVSSLDKNFCVPVGASLVYAKDVEIIEEIGKMYPGRASAQQILDLFITLG